MIKLTSLLKEESVQYRVVFTDYGDEEYPVSALFNSEEEAEEWVISNEWEEHGVEEYDPTIDDYVFKTRNRYYNPEDNENYFGYSIEPVTSSINEFTPNPAETPEIYYGNEKRKYFKQPSLDNQDMNAINPTHPIPEADMCTECGGGGCSQCGHEEESGDIWGQPSEDHESTMARGELKSLISNASKIYSMIEPGTELPGWVSAYITLASDYMNSVAQYASEASSH